MRVQNIKELKAVVSHWTEKWQKVAMTLQSTQEELQELRKNKVRQFNFLNRVPDFNHKYCYISEHEGKWKEKMELFSLSVFVISVIFMVN